MISNPGSLNSFRGNVAMLQLVPPQVCAIAMGEVRNGVIAEDDGSIRVGKMLTITIAADHRAMDPIEAEPFIRMLDKLIGNPELLREYI